MQRQHEYDVDPANAERRRARQRAAYENAEFRERNLARQRETSCTPEFLRRKREKHQADPRQGMLNGARQRARQRGVPCTITLDDIVVPDVCPRLGIPISVGQGGKHDGSPTIDRVVPGLGYVPGNIAVISYRANRLKSDGTLDEFRMLVENWHA